MEILVAVFGFIIVCVMIAALVLLIRLAWWFLVAIFSTIVHEFRKPLGSDVRSSGDSNNYIDDDEIDGMNEGDFRRYL